ncbi:unnamed protein product [Medioppia subpectinata]|uniref:Uncharacterized protein n=1 Tax=Medioppia subpectinata TaxID=1979941 RepID=A0A7R9KL53_9ACAR|nr:unnamed protein product [Medioppia subpectinata]CAG2105656.1 unnamed protein product [Medioppia subpectinata]
MRYNFNALTCESCKVMFRRNARNFEESIMTAEQKEIRLRKIEANRGQKSVDTEKTISNTRPSVIQSTDTQTSAAPVESMSVLKKFDHLESDYEKLKARLTELEAIIKNNNITVNNNYDNNYNNSQNCCNTHNDSNNSIVNQLMPYKSEYQSVYERAVELELSFAPSVGHAINPLNRMDMSYTEVESTRLHELVTAVNAIRLQDWTQINEWCQRRLINEFNNGLQDSLNTSKMLGLYLERVTQGTVQMAKCLPAFTQLPEDDRIALIKYGCFDICALRSVLCFNYDHEYWNFQMRNLYDRYRNFIANIGREWDSDTIIIDLLSIILLFNPDREWLMNREVIRMRRCEVRLTDPDKDKLLIHQDIIGYNFNALTCESCKVMFRRNAHNIEKYECNFNGNCRIDIKSRKLCKSCRLRKCFANGMKIDNIMTAEQIQRRRDKIEANRVRKAVNSAVTATRPSVITAANPQTSAAPVESMAVLKKFDHLESDYEKLKARFNELEAIIKDNNIIPKSNYNSNNSNQNSGNNHNESIANNLMPYKSEYKSVYERAVELELSFAPSVSRPLNPMDTSFTETEITRLRELLSAANAIQPQNWTEITISCQNELIVQFNNGNQCSRNTTKMLAIYLERVTEGIMQMSKCLPAFNQLSDTDQLSLIKYGCFDICALRSVLCFNYDYEYWNYQMGADKSVILKLDLLKAEKRNIYGSYHTFLTNIGRQWDSDPIVIDLLTTILLFNPDRPELMSRELIRLQQNIYMYLLQRYLIIKYGSESEAKTKLLTIGWKLTAHGVIKHPVYTGTASAATLAENKEFIRCAKERTAALENLNEEELINLTQQNLVTASAMVAKRAAAAQRQGLVCYNNFNTVYGPGVLAIMGPTGEPKVLSTATSAEQRATATKQIAGMTQLIMCDEAYRANHVDDIIQCNFFDRNGGAAAQFAVKLPLLESVMGVGGVLLKGASPPMASVVTQIKNLYGDLYATGKTCSESKDLTPDQQCANLKMLDLELDRLGELGALAVASKLPFL